VSTSTPEFPLPRLRCEPTCQDCDCPLNQQRFRELQIFELLACSCECHEGKAGRVFGARRLANAEAMGLEPPTWVAVAVARHASH
jgi:hypothetical protein